MCSHASQIAVEFTLRMCVGLWHWPPGWALACGWALIRSKKDLVSLHSQNVSSFRYFCFISFINAAPLLSSGLWLLFPALGRCLLAGHLWNSGANIFAVCDAVTTILPWGIASGTKATFLPPADPHTGTSHARLQGAGDFCHGDTYHRGKADRAVPGSTALYMHLS